MNKQLQPTPFLHCLAERRMYTGLCILFLMIGSAAHSQPAMLSGIGNGSKNFVYVNSRLYYSTADSLFTASATSSSVLVLKTGEPILAVYDMTVASSFFFVTQSASGQSLWRSDGTAGNTVRLTTQTQITPLLAYHSQLFMRVSSGALGIELWKADALNNVTAVKDINPGAANGFIGSLIAHNDLLYFFASAGSGVDLWQSDGTTNGTVESVDLDDTDFYNGSGFYGLTSVNDIMFFTWNYEDPEWGLRHAELWKTDGTAAGTSRVVRYANAYAYNYFSNFIAFHGKLYFFHSIGDPAYHYVSVSDGTSAGTQHLVRASIDGAPRVLIDAGAYFLYYAESQSFTTPIQKSDGTTSTTVHVFSMYHSTQDTFIDLTYTGGRAFFLDDIDDYYGGGSELWQADLSSGVTRPVKELFDISSVSGSGNIVAADGSIFFTRLISGRMSLWYYDPSAPPGLPPSVTITQPSDSAAFVAPATINIVATAEDPDGTITKVEFYSSDNETFLGVDTTVPYTYQWQHVPAGNYILEARATDNQGYMRSGFRSITVSSPVCSGTGNIYREIWVNAAGTDVRSFDFSTSPNGSGKLYNSFETPQYYGNNYASRMRGYVCVPQSGDYTLWISSDDDSELYLSTDESETNKKLIAWVYGHTPFRNYDKYPSQKSARINLQEGQRYYIEVRHKEGDGNDFISVGWQLPDGTMERPIPGDRLIPILPVPDEPPVITVTSPEPNQNFSSADPVVIAANVTDADGVKNVKFDVVYGGTSTTLASFSDPPYEYQWNNVPAGSYQLIVSASDNRNTSTSRIVFFSVDASTCAGAGTIVREIWTGIPGTSISSIPLNSPPDRSVELTSFATTNYYGNDYGSRIRGYVCAPSSGVYTFWIAGDDDSELWLSDNDDPAARRRIAYVSGATRVNQWNKYSTQMSGVVNLVQGQRYYIEVLHKEANGADHVEVGWQLPSGALEQPIPGNRLIPFEDPSARATVFLAGNEYRPAQQDNVVSIYPNPAARGKQLSIQLPGGTGTDVHVDIRSVTGVSVQSETIPGTGNEVIIDLKPSIAAGIYLIQISGNKKTWSSKLQVQ